MTIATVYCTLWNEELRLPHFIKHYRKRLPECNIVIFDNESSDASPKIALDNGCSVVSFGTDGKVSDPAIISCKNNCWVPWNVNANPWECWHEVVWTAQNEIDYLNTYPEVQELIDNKVISCGMKHYLSNRNWSVPNRPQSSSLACQTEWCIVVDCDEFLEVNEDTLVKADYNIIKAEFYDMYGENNDVDSMVKGCEIAGSKTLCWKTKDFYSINYQVGAHHCSPNPVKEISYNKEKIMAYHMKWVSFDYVMDRYRNFCTRDHENYKRSMGIHAHFPEQHQRDYYNNLGRNAVNVRIV